MTSLCEDKGHYLYLQRTQRELEDTKVESAFSLQFIETALLYGYF